MASSFSADLSKFVDKATNNADAIMRKSILDIGKELVEMSPVGDANYWKMPPPPGYVGGRFRGNWQHGTGSMPLTKFDTTDNVSNGRIASTMPIKVLEKIHFIVNNVPYSIALENGRSRQAPRGIVGLTITRWKKIVKKAANELS